MWTVESLLWDVPTIADMSSGMERFQAVSIIGVPENPLCQILGQRTDILDISHNIGKLAVISPIEVSRDQLASMLQFDMGTDTDL